MFLAILFFCYFIASRDWSLLMNPHKYQALTLMKRCQLLVKLSQLLIHYIKKESKNETIYQFNFFSHTLRMYCSKFKVFLTINTHSITVSLSSKYPNKLPFSQANISYKLILVWKNQHNFFFLTIRVRYSYLFLTQHSIGFCYDL